MADLIRPLDGAAASPSRHADEREVELVVGTKVEARYQERAKWYAGTITRVRLNGTFDIDYDDGEKEMGVKKEMVRALGKSVSARPARLEEGMKVEARYRGRERWFPGRISRDRGDGTYDVDYSDGEKEARVLADLIRPLDSYHSKYGVDKRRDDESRYDSRYADEKDGEHGISKSHREQRLLALRRPQQLEKVNQDFQRSQRVACYWYRPSDFGCARHFPIPKSAIVLNFNSDGTYTVELELERKLVDDVPSHCLKDWAEVWNSLYY